AFYTALSNVALFPFTIGLFALTTYEGNFYATILLGSILVAFNVWFLIANLKMMKNPASMNAWRVFKMSTSYLFVVLLLVVMAHFI
ncbi:MAG TPA: hypothetical protein VE862_12160, partial [Candidatus Acidoferrum sp.]|nr:hypothetical protein [Candidatus Acidoferrum sp.]